MNVVEDMKNSNIYIAMKKNNGKTEEIAKTQIEDFQLWLVA